MALPKRSLLKATGLLFAVSSLFSCAPHEVRQMNLIPKPAQIEWGSGYFKADSNLVFDSGSIRYIIDGEGKILAGLLVWRGKAVGHDDAQKLLVV